MPIHPTSHMLAMRRTVRCVSGRGLLAPTITAIATGPTPAAVSAEAAARCPALHASSLRIVDGIRIPAKGFLGNFPIAAMRPSAINVAPANPVLVAPDMCTRIALAIGQELLAGALHHEAVWLRT
jgi:hypothetical protein